MCKIIRWKTNKWHHLRHCIINNQYNVARKSKVKWKNQRNEKKKHHQSKMIENSMRFIIWYVIFFSLLIHSLPDLYEIPKRVSKKKTFRSIRKRRLFAINKFNPPPRPYAKFALKVSPRSHINCHQNIQHWIKLFALHHKTHIFHFQKKKISLTRHINKIYCYMRGGKMNIKYYWSPWAQEKIS